jgi:hypothetical protein
MIKRKKESNRLRNKLNLFQHNFFFDEITSSISIKIKFRDSKQRTKFSLLIIYNNGKMNVSLKLIIPFEIQLINECISSKISFLEASLLI